MIIRFCYFFRHVWFNEWVQLELNLVQPGSCLHGYVLRLLIDQFGRHGIIQQKLHRLTFILMVCRLLKVLEYRLRKHNHWITTVLITAPAILRPLGPLLMIVVILVLILRIEVAGLLFGRVRVVILSVAIVVGHAF